MADAVFILERFTTGLDHLRFDPARRSARRDAKSDAKASVERRNEAGARRIETRRAGRFWGVGLSKGLPVVSATGCALLLPTTQNRSDAGDSIRSQPALGEQL